MQTLDHSICQFLLEWKILSQYLYTTPDPSVKSLTLHKMHCSIISLIFFVKNKCLNIRIVSREWSISVPKGWLPSLNELIYVVEMFFLRKYQSFPIYNLFILFFLLFISIWFYDPNRLKVILIFLAFKIHLFTFDNWYLLFLNVYVYILECRYLIYCHGLCSFMIIYSFLMIESPYLLFSDFPVDALTWKFVCRCF